MKQLLAIAALALSGIVQASTVGFTGAYAPGNWTQSIDGNGAISASATSVSLTSPDDLANGGSTRFSIVMLDAGWVSFDWDYATQDDPFYDMFGYELNGLFTAVSDNAQGAPQSQSGTASVLVTVGDVFAFREWAVDDFGGSSTTRISNFSIPEPGSLALAALALVGAVVARRRRVAA